MLAVAITASWLITIVRILLLMTSFLFLSEHCQLSSEITDGGRYVELTSANACQFFLV
jgi:hypothetical protein